MERRRLDGDSNISVSCLACSFHDTCAHSKMVRRWQTFPSMASSVPATIHVCFGRFRRTLSPGKYRTTPGGSLESFGEPCQKNEGPILFAHPFWEGAALRFLLSLLFPKMTQNWQPKRSANVYFRGDMNSKPPGPVVFQNQTTRPL